MDEVFYVVAAQTYFIFTPKIGEIIQVDEHILQLETAQPVYFVLD